MRADVPKLMGKSSFFFSNAFPLHLQEAAKRLLDSASCYELGPNGFQKHG